MRSSNESMYYARRRKRRMQRRLRFVCAAVCILVLAGIITLIISLFDKKGKQDDSLEPEQTSTVLAPLPMQVTVNKEVWPVTGPAIQTKDYTIRSTDYDLMALPECGRVDTSYFSDAAFLGDSITEGFTEYNVEMQGALICGYVGLTPKTVVDGTAVNHPERGSEVPLDVLAARQPAKLYILLGTNTLVNDGAEDNFIAYYGRMLDELKSRLPDTLIYVQAVPPVQTKAVVTRPGLEKSKVQAVNVRLAKLALEKGCSFLDLYGAMADENGDLNADYAESDGVHFTASSGYPAWVNFLCTHTVYSKDNPWAKGSAYYMG